MVRRRLIAAWLLVPALGCSGAGAGDTGARLQGLFDREWEMRLREEPLLATAVGRHEYGDRLADESPTAHERRAAASRELLAELDGIVREGLDERQRIDADIFRSQLEDRIAYVRFRAFEIPFNADSGFHTEFASLPDQVPLRTLEDYENYIARLRAFPGWVEQHIANMRAGLARGMTQPRVVLDGLDATIAAHVVRDPSASIFWKPFVELSPSVPEAAHARLRAAGRDAIEQAIVPGYAGLLEFMRDEYVPGARTSLGAAALPDGEAFYRQQIRFFTTLDLEPARIHEIGLAEVARIRAEMEEVIRQVGFEGDFDLFLEFLRTDPRFYARTPDELLHHAAYLAKKIDGRLPALFRTLPRLPYGVEPVPDHIAPKYTAGRYVPAPVGGTRAGTYWVNTYALEMRPLYALEALTLHEAVPGHHLQIALSNEIEALPDFRRYSYISAFGEGWGLYAEWLGLEAGFYTDPYSNFGRLTYEMWRACRLVVDTGIHAMGWTREQAIDYLARNTALSLHEVRTEIDRYISWPAQALAYKLGEIKIRELRRRAEQALGQRFDVRDFHDAVLLQGSVPLPVLERQIDRYVETAREPTR